MADAAYPPKARLKTSCRRPAASRVERVPRDAFGPSHQGGDVAAAIEDMQNKHVLALDAVEDDVGIYREAPQTRAQVAALPANVRMGGEQVKTAADGIHYAVGAFDAAAFLGDVEPDVVQLGGSLRRQAMRHQRRAAFP